MVLAVSPPSILQIFREPIKPGDETMYAAIETETARACFELKCPHPHLALQPLEGPSEIWWLNFFASETDRQRVTDAYLENRPLMAVLERNGKRKSVCTGTPADLILGYRSDLSHLVEWKVAGARFFAVTVTTGPVVPEGAVFEAPDGTLYVLRTAARAEHLVSGNVGKTTVLAVRPLWGLPAKEWVDAHPEFWAANPASR